MPQGAKAQQIKRFPNWGRGEGWSTGRQLRGQVMALIRGALKGTWYPRAGAQPSALQALSVGTSSQAFHHHGDHLRPSRAH